MAELAMYSVVGQKQQRVSERDLIFIILTYINFIIVRPSMDLLLAVELNL